MGLWQCLLMRDGAKQHMSVTEKLCSKDNELLATLYWALLHSKSFHLIAFSVYTPPSSNAAAACELLHSAVNHMQSRHLQTLLPISRYFNHASLSSVLTQYVTYHMGENKKLNLLNANVKDTYTFESPPTAWVF